MDKEKKLNGGRDKSKDSPRTGLEESFVLYDHKKLKMGYTTGSCAAAAAKAGTRTLLTGVETEEIVLDTPKGIRLHLPVEDIHIQRDESGIPVKVCCAVRKDGGDDIDATNGALIYA